MHNLSTVIRFEITRSLKKKSFWLAAISFPLVFAVLFGVIFLSNKASEDAAKNLEKQAFSFAVTDESKLVKPELLAATKAQPVAATDKDATIKRVQEGKLDAYIYYPKDIAKERVEVYGKDVGLFDNGRYSGIATSLLSNSVQSEVSPAVRMVIQDKINTKNTVYKNGKEYNAINEMILPGLFLVLFYFLISFFGNQMLTSTTEEKENRVIEMILTTVHARTLIIGKIISLIVLAFIQGLLVILPVLIAYLFFKDQLQLPDVDLSHIAVDPVRIGIGFLAFSASFLFFTGMLVAIGAAVPTAKEAGSFFATIMILLFAPLYAAAMLVSTPDALPSKIITYFPLTSPIPLMLRNAIGNLSAMDAAISISILAVCAVIAIMMGVRLFRFGALEYSRKLSLREIFTRK